AHAARVPRPGVAGILELDAEVAAVGPRAGATIFIGGAGRHEELAPAAHDEVEPGAETRVVGRVAGESLQRDVALAAALVDVRVAAGRRGVGDGGGGDDADAHAGLLCEFGEVGHRLAVAVGVEVASLAGGAETEHAVVGVHPAHDGADGAGAVGGDRGGGGGAGQGGGGAGVHQRVA